MMSETRKQARPAHTSALPGRSLALLVLVVCGVLMISQIHTAIVFQQQGVATQSVIVALDHCSIPNRQPNASASQQGVLLTLRFLDTTGSMQTITFPGCQQGTYHVGDRFPVRYLPAHPTLVMRASSAFPLPQGVVLPLLFLGIAVFVSGAIVAVGAFELLLRWRYRRVLVALRRQDLKKKDRRAASKPEPTR